MQVDTTLIVLVYAASIFYLFWDLNFEENIVRLSPPMTGSKIVFGEVVITGFIYGKSSGHLCMESGSVYKPWALRKPANLGFPVM